MPHFHGLMHNHIPTPAKEGDTYVSISNLTDASRDTFTVWVAAYVFNQEPEISVHNLDNSNNWERELQWNEYGSYPTYLHSKEIAEALAKDDHA